VAAYLIDVLIALVVPVIITFIIGRILRAAGLIVPQENYDPREQWVGFGAGLKMAVLISFLLYTGPIYFILCHASPWQATFGKRLMNIFVSRDSSERISAFRSAGRWLAMFLAALLGGNFVSLVTIAASRRGKALHDFVAGTVVLRGRPADSAPLGLWRVAASFGIPILWMTITVLATSPRPTINQRPIASSTPAGHTHSHRSAASGAIRVARRAGIALAATPAASITPSTAP
jgi:uncharacterized RDD family membrane protein YckC